MRESTLNAAVNKRIQQLHPNWIVWKMSNQFRKGIPDNYYRSENKELWCEFKFTNAPSKIILLETCKYLTNHQKMELNRLHDCHAQTAVVFATPTAYIIRYGLDWQSPIKRDDLQPARHPSTAICNEIVEFLHS